MSQMCFYFLLKNPFTPPRFNNKVENRLLIVRGLRLLVSDLIGIGLFDVRRLFRIRHGSPQLAELFADFGHLQVWVRLDNLRSLVVHEEKVRGQVSFRRVRVFHLLRFLHLLRGFRSLGHCVCFWLVLFWVFLNEKGEEEAFLSQFSRWKKKIIAAAKDQIWTRSKKRAFDLYESKNFERRKIKSSLLLQSHLTTALLPDQRKKDRKLFSRSFRVHFDRYFTYLIGYIVSFLTRILIRDLFSFSLLIVSSLSLPPIICNRILIHSIILFKHAPRIKTTREDHARAARRVFRYFRRTKIRTIFFTTTPYLVSFFQTMNDEFLSVWISFFLFFFRFFPPPPPPDGLGRVSDFFFHSQLPPKKKGGDSFQTHVLF